ncbi:hypothetical protein SDC9_124203 [bioreactor metagenome]|uniref:Uncharacterized protein n=1 Tax=bioreactor metagenome TaxID=1076179 RepID=A0A645CJV1_9ZZZZ
MASPAQLFREFARAAHLGQAQGHRVSRELRLRKGASAHGVVYGDDFDRQPLYPRVLKIALEPAAESLRILKQLFFGFKDHVHRRYRAAVPAQVEAQRRLAGGQRHLVDAQRAQQLM